MTLKIQDELAARSAEADAWRAQAVERARGETELARQRYMSTQPDNRLVADVLEVEWNARLRALEDARRELEQRRAGDPAGLDDAQRQRILSLATDFPRLWQDPATPDRERKRMARLLIEDVTITRSTEYRSRRTPAGRADARTSPGSRTSRLGTVSHTRSGRGNDRPPPRRAYRLRDRRPAQRGRHAYRPWSHLPATARIPHTPCVRPDVAARSAARPRPVESRRNRRHARHLNPDRETMASPRPASRPSLQRQERDAL